MKEEVAAQVAEHKVEVTGMPWLRTFLGGRTAEAIMDLPWDPALLVGPHPPALDHPLLMPPESPVWTLRFVMHRVHHKISGRGRWVLVDEWGVHKDKPLRVGGGGSRGMARAAGNAGGEEGRGGPPFQPGGEDV